MNDQVKHQKFTIYRDRIVFHLMFDDQLVIPIHDFEDIARCVKQSRHEEDIKEYGSTDYGYTHFCNGCNKLDYIVQGYCQPCFVSKGLKYEDDSLN